jgi:hypothetical protein
MAHHLAELMNESKNAATPRERRLARDHATQLILRIWDHRRNLHANIDPLATYKDVLPALKLISLDSRRWLHGNNENRERLAAKLFQHAQQIVVLVLGEVFPPKPKRPAPPEIVIKFLSSTEKNVSSDVESVFENKTGNNLATEIEAMQKILTKLHEVMDKRDV